MIKYFLIKLNEIRKSISKGTFKKEVTSLFKTEVVPVEKDLQNITEVPNRKIDELKLVIKDTKQEDYKREKYKFPDNIRKNKAELYYKKDFNGILILDGNNVLGHIWYTDLKNKTIHQNIKLLKLEMSPEKVYLFDLFVVEKIRGNNFSTNFMNNSLYNLKMKGYKKAYGYFSVDNLQALWVHRLLGYKELNHLIWKRRLFSKISIPVK